MRLNHTSPALAALILVLCLTSPARADQDLRIPVTLRPGVEAELAVTVREPPGRPRCAAGPVAVAVHGLAHTAATFTPLIDELLRAGAAPRCGIAVLDLPGHGRSGLPVGAAFGQLLLDDYVTALLAALEGLRGRGLRPRVLVGHSMGGLVIELSQSRLLAQGTSLRRRDGVVAAALLSPTPAAEHPWAFAESGVGAAVLGGYVVVDPLKGPVLRVDPATWIGFFFSDLAGRVIAAAPAPAEVAARGYLSDESAFAGSQILGLPPFSRPAVGARPFALRHGTLLLYFNPGQDPFSLRAEAQAAYLQLTGDRSRSGFIEIDDADGVHDMHVAQPARYLRSALLGALTY